MFGTINLTPGTWVQYSGASLADGAAHYGGIHNGEFAVHERNITTDQAKVLTLRALGCSALGTAKLMHCGLDVVHEESAALRQRFSKQIFSGVVTSAFRSQIFTITRPLEIPGFQDHQWKLLQGLATDASDEDLAAELSITTRQVRTQSAKLADMLNLPHERLPLITVAHLSGAVDWLPDVYDAAQAFESHTTANTTAFVGLDDHVLRGIVNVAKQRRDDQ